MARRKAYTKVIKENQIREDHVKGMGDVVFKGFQCINPKCTQFLFVRTDEITDAFNVECPTCSFNMKSGEETKFYDYELFHKVDKKVIEKGGYSGDTDPPFRAY